MSKLHSYDVRSKGLPTYWDLKPHTYISVKIDPVVKINYTQENEVVTLTASGKKYKYVYYFKNGRLFIVITIIAGVTFLYLPYHHKKYFEFNSIPHLTE